jgi:hypothetical protein
MSIVKTRQHGVSQYQDRREKVNPTKEKKSKTKQNGVGSMLTCFHMTNKMQWVTKQYMITTRNSQRFVGAFKIIGTD